jgi:hypothetical protein
MQHGDQRELRNLRRSLRVTQAALAGAAILSVALSSHDVGSPSNEPVTSRAFIVVDEHGKEQAAFGHLDGETRLLIRDGFEIRHAPHVVELRLGSGELGRSVILHAIRESLDAEKDWERADVFAGSFEAFDRETGKGFAHISKEQGEAIVVVRNGDQRVGLAAYEGLSILSMGDGTVGGETFSVRTSSREECRLEMNVLGGGQASLDVSEKRPSTMTLQSPSGEKSTKLSSSDSGSAVRLDE